MTAIPDEREYVPRFCWGTIAPRSNKQVAIGPGYEFYRLLGPDIIQVKTELGITEFSTDAVNLAIDRFFTCVELLQREGADRIVLSGVPIASRLGRKRVLELFATAQERTGIPLDGPLEAVIAAMNHLGLSKLALASRWTKDLNDDVVAYLAAGGVEVVFTTERGQWAAESAAMTMAQGMHLALEVGREAALGDSDAEAIFVAGGAALSLHVVPLLEAEFGKPVLTNFSAEVFAALVRPGVIGPIDGWGRLLAGG